MKRLIAWLFGCSMLLLRWTCRSRFHNDPRPSLRRRGIRFTYAGLHAQQLGCVMTAEPGCAALASRSTDGDMVVPTLELCGFKTIRGSSGRGRKGGAVALQQLIQYVRETGPGAITVDGPRGPRGKVQPGIGLLAAKADALVVPVFPMMHSRWIVKSSWDRMQIPMPFCRIDVYFGDPVLPGPDDTAQDIAREVERSLLALESKHDPAEARFQYNAADDTLGAPATTSGDPAIPPASTARTAA